jgi:hypothetical protein
MKWIGSMIAVGACVVGVNGCVMETAYEGDELGMGGESSVRTVEQKIIEGQQVFGRYSIGQIQRAPGPGRRGGFCTATLITNRYALTAAHCMNNERYQDTTPSPGDRYHTYYADRTDSQVPTHYYSFGGYFEEKIFNGWSSDVALIRLPNSFAGTPAEPVNRIVQQRSRGGTTWSARFGYGCNNRDFASVGGTGAGTLRFKAFQGLTSNLLCSGDSGGPTMLGRYSYASDIYGVNSGVSFDLSAGGTFDVVADATYHKKYIEGMMVAWDGERLMDVDRSGADYRSFATTLAQACANACTNDAQCFSWTYYNRTCYLKDAVPGFTPLTGAVSAVKTARSTPWEVGFDRPGSDYHNLLVSNAGQCRDACAQDYRCQSFTVTPPVSGSQSRCWLKDEQPNPVRRSGYTSGAKRGFRMQRTRSVAAGSLFHHFTYSMPSPEICQSECAKDSRCKSWAYQAPWIRQQGEGAHCWLYNDKGTYYYDRYKVSGEKGAEFL